MSAQSANVDRNLHEAAWCGDEALVSQLLEQKAWRAKVDWKGLGDWTALHEAASNGHTPVVTRLLDAGWSLDAQTRDGATPLTLAAWNAHLETAKCLLSRKAKIDAQDEDKRSPLHDASSQGHSSLLNLLLQCGANQDIRNRKGKTAEEEAATGEIRAAFRDFNDKGLKNQDEFLIK